MNVIHQPSDLAGAPRSVCLAIGVFDGVHLGHQQVIRQAIADASHHEALSVVVTFDRHPSAVLAPESMPRSIYSLEQKLDSIASLGVDSTLLLPFTREFSQLPAAAFVDNLMKGLGNILSICVGRDFTFGHRRGGNVELLRAMGAANGFDVHGIAAVGLDSETISSTRIRSAIASGDLDRAGQMLGRDYRLRGAVMRGDGIGRKLGFPTANIDVEGLQTPPNGVYIVHAFHKKEVLRGVANIGTRPSVSKESGQALRLEVHLLDRDLDLYGESLEVQFLKDLRAEERFPDLESLTAQIRRDVGAAQDFFRPSR